MNPQAVLHHGYQSWPRLLSKHICVSVVQPFLLHPPLNKLYGGQEAKTEQPRAHYALFTQKEAPARLLLLTTWIHAFCPGWGEPSSLVLTVTHVKVNAGKMHTQQ